MHRRKTVILAQAMVLTFNARRKYKDLKTRTHVAKEIVSTEEYYVTNLKYMSEVHLYIYICTLYIVGPVLTALCLQKLYDPLLAEAMQSRSLNPEDVKKIFSQIKGKLLYLDMALIINLCSYCWCQRVTARTAANPN